MTTRASSKPPKPLTAAERQEQERRKARGFYYLDENRLICSEGHRLLWTATKWDTPLEERHRDGWETLDVHRSRLGKFLGKEDLSKQCVSKILTRHGSPDWDLVRAFQELPDYQIDAVEWSRAPTKWEPWRRT